MMSPPHPLKEYTSPSVIILCIIFNSSSVPVPTKRRVGKKEASGMRGTAFSESFISLTQVCFLEFLAKSIFYVSKAAASSLFSAHFLFQLSKRFAYVKMN